MFNRPRGVSAASFNMTDSDDDFDEKDPFQTDSKPAKKNDFASMLNASLAGNSVPKPSRSTGGSSNSTSLSSSSSARGRGNGGKVNMKNLLKDTKTEFKGTGEPCGNMDCLKPAFKDG